MFRNSKLNRYRFANIAECICLDIEASKAAVLLRLMDITYIPMARGFVYLAAVFDWFSRRVLA
jgi:hypothetical protein